MATSRIYKNQYLTIEATTNGSVSVFLSSALTTTDLASFSYSKDQTHWTTTNTDGTDKTITINLNGGETLYLKGSGKTYNHATNNANPIFTITCYANVYGNIMSLLYGDNFRTADTVYNYSFMSMFRNCTTIDTENLVMPATTLGQRCYESMFRGCTRLMNPPELPATTLEMYCYRAMFFGCTALNKKISLPSTTLAGYCYDSMFRGCTSLTVSPTLKAGALVQACYNNMFRECSSLNYIRMYCHDDGGSGLANWVNGVAETGTFIKNPNWNRPPRGVNGIPSGWTVKNYDPNEQAAVYDFGDEIPGYVSYTYTPKIWYDQSKSTDGGTWNIFNELGIAETLILGESEDDLWTLEEILDEICRYFNLHIVQLGYDFYIFDWETAKSGNSVTWVNILDGTTKNSTYSTITPTLSSYADDSTQISLGECYDQVMLTDEVEEFDDLKVSPFDSSNIESLCQKQIYMRELYATGEGNKAREAFIDLLNGETGTPYNDGKDSAWTRDWWFNVIKPKYWNFSTAIWGDNYSRVPKDANDKYYQQWRLAQWVDSCPWASGMFRWYKGDKVNNKNLDTQNIIKSSDYIVINVKGNGNDNNTGGTIYPNDNDIRYSGMKIEYINANDGIYSSADPSITNYLVFTGNLILTTAHERTGPQGFIFDGNGPSFYRFVNEWTKNANDGKQGYYYLDNEAFKRKNNNMASARALFNQSINPYGWKYYTVGSDDNDDGRFYTNMFFEQWYPTDTDERPTETNTYLAPPCAEGTLSKRFKYDLSNKTSYYYKDGGYDTIRYIDVLACKLQIGDKYCCESVDDNGNKKFDWYTEDELKQLGKYLETGDGSTMYDAYIYLAIDVNDGEYLVGQSHKIYNNISTGMGLDVTGMAVPLPYSAHLSGVLRFSIEGIVNSSWDNGVRKHHTWFRHTQYTQNWVPIMSHVDKIYIEEFDFEPKSDYGKVLVNDDNDIVYLSNEIRKYTKRKDDIKFKFNTALTASESSAMGVKPIFAKSTVVNITTGDAILGIVNNMTSETDKPEKFYVDAYWREYNEPRMVINTALKDTNSFAHLDVTQFNKLNLSFIDDKTFFVTKTERNLKNETINLTIKERNQ